MALDAICLQAILEELRPKLLGLRVDKVQQPSRDQLILLLRGNRLCSMPAPMRLAFNSRSWCGRIQQSRRCFVCCCANT